MSQYRDLAGRRFGRLTALSPTMRRDRKGSVYWRCRCDCGKETEVTADGLVHGNCKSCGCLQKEIRQSISSRLHRVDHTCVEWLEKRKHRSDNTSGFRGVCRLKNGKFRVLIGFQRQRYYIGTFSDFEAAVAARLEAEERIHHSFVNAYYRWQEKGGDTPFSFEVRKVDGKYTVVTEK